MARRKRSRDGWKLAATGLIGAGVAGGIVYLIMKVAEAPEPKPEPAPEPKPEPAPAPAPAPAPTPPVTIQFPGVEWPRIEWPKIPEIKFPELPRIEWPRIEWPKIPEIKFPELPRIEWPNIPVPTGLTPEQLEKAAEEYAVKYAREQGGEAVKTGPMEWVIKYPFPAVLYVSLAVDHANIHDVLPDGIPATVTVEANGFRSVRSVSLYTPGSGIHPGSGVLNFKLPNGFRDKTSITVKATVSGRVTGPQQRRNIEKTGGDVKVEVVSEQQEARYREVRMVEETYVREYSVSYTATRHCTIGGGKGVFKGWGEGGGDLEDAYIFSFQETRIPVSVAERTVAERLLGPEPGKLGYALWTRFKPWFIVKHADGTPVSNASVKVVAGGVAYVSRTNGNGRVEFDKMPWDDYYHKKTDIYVAGRLVKTVPIFAYVHTTTVTIPVEKAEVTAAQTEIEALRSRVRELEARAHSLRQAIEQAEPVAKARLSAELLKVTTELAGALADLARAGG